MSLSTVMRCASQRNKGLTVMCNSHLRCALAFASKSESRAASTAARGSRRRRGVGGSLKRPGRTPRAASTAARGGRRRRGVSGSLKRPGCSPRAASTAARGGRRRRGVGGSLKLCRRHSCPSLTPVPFAHIRNQPAVSIHNKPCDSPKRAQGKL